MSTYDGISYIIGVTYQQIIRMCVQNQTLNNITTIYTRWHNVKRHTSRSSIIFITFVRANSYPLRRRNGLYFLANSDKQRNNTRTYGHSKEVCHAASTLLISRYSDMIRIRTGTG